MKQAQVSHLRLLPLDPSLTNVSCSQIRWRPLIPGSLEGKPECKLNLPFRELPGVVDHAEAAVLYVRIRIYILRMVKDVECLRAELHFHPLCQSEVFEQRRIPGAVTRPIEVISSKSAGTGKLAGGI